MKNTCRLRTIWHHHHPAGTFGILSNFFLVFLKKVSDLLLFSVQTFHFFRYLPFYPNPHFKEWNKSQKFDSVILVEGCKDHLRASVLVVQVRNLRTTPSLGLLMQKNAEFKSHFTCEKWTVTTKLSSSQEQLGSTIFQVQRTNWWMGKVVEFQDHFVTNSIPSILDAFSVNMKLPSVGQAKNSRERIIGFSRGISPLTDLDSDSFDPNKFRAAIEH